MSSIYSLIDIANKINRNKLSSFELEVLYNEIPENYKQDLIYPYINIEENMVKISTRVKDSENIKRANLINEIKNYTDNSFDNLEEVKINGLLVLYNNMLSSLFSCVSVVSLFSVVCVFVCGFIIIC